MPKTQQGLKLMTNFKFIGIFYGFGPMGYTVITPPPIPAPRDFPRVVFEISVNFWEQKISESCGGGVHSPKELFTHKKCPITQSRIPKEVVRGGA